MESIEYYENAIRQGEKHLLGLEAEIKSHQNLYDRILDGLIADRQSLDELRAAELAEQTEDRLAEMDVWTR